MDDIDTHPPIMITAGGTGGHLFPAQALAQELARRNRKTVVVTDKRGLAWEKNFPEAPMHPTMSGTTEQTGAINRLAAIVRLLIGTAQAFSLIGKYKPNVVVGFGGYPSLPAMFAAVLRFKKTCLHEQNRVMGRANRLIAPAMKRLALTFPEPKGLRAREAKRSQVTGNPVRDAVIARRDDTYEPFTESSAIRILVFGGSQGATIFSDVVPDAIRSLPLEIRSRIELTQQCRSEDIDRVREKYEEMSISVEIDAFFSDLPDRMSDSHLIISRSGASTVCELMVIGRPAVMVPLGVALDGDQAANAKFLEENGGGWMIPEPEFTAPHLAMKLAEILSDPQGLAAAAEKSKRLGKPNAVYELADLVEQLEDADGKGN